MALKEFEGKTFVAFIDISGFKQMMLMGEAVEALNEFYQIGYDVLADMPHLSGIFISDCGIVYHNIENKSIEDKLSSLLNFVRQINEKMLQKNYLLTTSISYGDFKYSTKIELSNMSKNPLIGNAYLEAYNDNENILPKIKAGECRITKSTNDNEFNLSEDFRQGFKIKDTNKHYYYYWLLKNTQNINDYEASVKAIDDSISQQKKDIDNNKYIQLKSKMKAIMSC